MRRMMPAMIGLAVFFAASRFATAAEVPEELTTPNYRTREITGIGPQADVQRQDPSNVIKVGDLFYVWHTRRKAGVHPYASTVYFASSTDGVHWTEHGEAIGKGEIGAWDSFGVITPYVAVLDGKYYLFYTGTSAAKPFRRTACTSPGPQRSIASTPVVDPTTPTRSETPTKARESPGASLSTPSAASRCTLFASTSICWCRRVTLRSGEANPARAVCGCLPSAGCRRRSSRRARPGSRTCRR